MKRLLGWYVWLKTSEKGAAAVEYALVIAVVVLAVLVALGLLADAISAKIDDIIVDVQAAG